MPTYEYRCEICGKFEHFQKITDQPLKTCPKCGGAIKRLISKAGIIFKGSGFHVTDYRKEKKEEAPKTAEKKTATKETKSSEAAASPKKSE